jgi:probable rRNA maturation factor
MLKFYFTNETANKFDKKFFGEVLSEFYSVLKPLIDKTLQKKTGYIDLILVSDKTIEKMNHDYRGKKKPTDVISFAYLEVTEFEKSKGDLIVGDIFISVDTAKKQALEKGHDIKKETAILFIHGLLHCFGFDHKTDKQESKMEKIASEILKKLF